jgi:hypothetical protein
MDSVSKDALLDEACKKYEAATQLCPSLHEAFYNWAIAISDRAKIRGRTKEAEELWKQVHSLVPRHIHSNRCSSCCIFINVVSRWTAILLSAGLYCADFSPIS